jgi:hypothetical protein
MAMSDVHEVISAFLDDEPFDADELATALADPAGRSMLIDSIALRHLAQPSESRVVLSTAARPSRSRIRTALAAAAVLVALAGGYFVGERRGAVSELEAPPATRVVQAGPAWR